MPILDCFEGILALLGLLFYLFKEILSFLTGLEYESRLRKEGRGILELSAQGLSNAEIARELNTSSIHIATVKTELFDIYGVKSEAELITEARRRGDLAPETESK